MTTSNEPKLITIKAWSKLHDIPLYIAKKFASDNAIPCTKSVGSETRVMSDVPPPAAYLEQREKQRHKDELIEQQQTAAAHKFAAEAIARVRKMFEDE